MRVSRDSVELMRGIVAEYDALEPSEKPKPPPTEPVLPASSAGGDQMTPPSHTGWDFFKSPQAYVIGCTLIVLATAAGMYSSLSGKIEAVSESTTTRGEAVRLELKADIQTLIQRTDARFDQVNSKFDSLMSKMDADSRELRTLILGQQRPQK